MSLHSLAPLAFRMTEVPAAPVDAPATVERAAPAIDDLGVLAADHAEAVFRVAVSVVRDRSLAEDVVQETLLKAWRNLDDLRDPTATRSWILRIAHNTAISLLRARREDLREPHEVYAGTRRPPPRPGVQPYDTTTRHLIRAEFEAALFTLDDLTRSILVLRELEHLSYEEIAETLDVPLPTVKTRLLRGRRRLAVALEGWR